jgi:hypothetical protein
LTVFDSYQVSEEVEAQFWPPDARLAGSFEAIFKRLEEISLKSHNF